MTVRKVKVFHSGADGFGCFEKIIDITTENFISENVDTITILDDDLNDCGDIVKSKILYYKSIDAFINGENRHFVSLIQDLVDKHEKTIKMAKEYKKLVF